ncbi:MAG: ABC transporter permease [Candidatus Hodarchaeales archaeon]|jgi:ABC-type dipeptide/oligopeptide/nickel transport system permease subunit
MSSPTDSNPKNDDGSTKLEQISEQDTVKSDLEIGSGATTWRIVLRRFRRNKVALLGLVFLGFFTFLALLSYLDNIITFIFGQGIFPYGPNDIFPVGPDNVRASSFELPSLVHFFGTDNVGRDIFVRIIYGARISMTVGFLAVIVSLSVGTFLGLIAGYYGGIIDSIISMVLEMLLAFPSILLALAIGFVYIPYYARIVRGQVFVERELIYVESAKVLGAKTPRILLKHILPNVFGVLIIYTSLGIGTAILEVAALSFLGLGALPPTAEWGSMIGDGRYYWASGPHLVFFPGIAILLAVLSFNLVGDGLREALDPRFKR